MPVMLPMPVMPPMPVMLPMLLFACTHVHAATGVALGLPFTL